MTDEIRWTGGCFRSRGRCEGMERGHKRFFLWPLSVLFPQVFGLLILTHSSFSSSMAASYGFFSLVPSAFCHFFPPERLLQLPFNSSSSAVSRVKVCNQSIFITSSSLRNKQKGRKTKQSRHETICYTRQIRHFLPHLEW